MGRTAGYRLCISFTAALLSALLMPALASAHVERASYWPDPAPDCSVSPCAGGQVPTARSLASAVTDANARVVCQPDSLKRAQQSIDSAQSTGYVLRPTQARAEDQRRRRPRPDGPEPQALQALPVRLDPGRRERSPATTAAS